jgi:hypothetical protein
VTRAVRNLFLVGAFALLALPSTAAADPLTDCVRDNDLDKAYSNSELRRALDDLPTDSDEYGLCREVIGGAIRDGSDRGNRPKDTGPNGQPLAADEQTNRANDVAELDAVVGKGNADPERPRVEVGGQSVQPGDDGTFDLASASNDLPTPLLLALIVLGLLAIAGVLVALRSRVPVLGRIPLLSKIPTARAPQPRSSRR